MGLDFGIQRRNISADFEGAAWEDIAWGRNCYKVRDIALSKVDTPANTYEYKVGFKVLNNILADLAACVKDIQDYYESDYYKLLYFISELADGLADTTYFMEEYNYQYEFKIINSY